MTIGRHYFISGRVQGVFYRDSTQKKAAELGITGWCRNTSDGRVECVAYGTEEQIKKLENWFWDGPPAADVNDIQSENIDPENINIFEVRR